MSFKSSLQILLITFALAACGEREFEPVVATVDDVEPLPAPLPAAGPVTGVPDAASHGAMPSAGALPPPDAASPLLLPAITPVPGSDGGSVAQAAGGDGEGTAAMITFADGNPADGTPLNGTPPNGTPLDGTLVAGTLPPLEDNPEAGLVAAPVAGTASVDRQAPDAARAAAAVRGYYDAVRAGDMARAYAAWSDGGRASGRTPEQFATGLEGLDIVSLSIGETGRVEGAAGSRQVEVPVTVTSRGSDGREVRQVGSFTMRSSQVEGAAPGWYITSAELRELRP